MTNQVSPFTKDQLLPQEETLEIYKHKGQLFLGIPKENAYQEKRVCLTPDAVAAITAHGHRVLFESGAGSGARFSDKDYSEAGAEITKDTKKVFSWYSLSEKEENGERFSPSISLRSIP